MNGLTRSLRSRDVQMVLPTMAMVRSWAGSCSTTEERQPVWPKVAAEAHRDGRRWSGAYRTFDRWASRTDFTDFEGEIRYVRQWIRDRWALMAAKLEPSHN